MVRNLKLNPHKVGLTVGTMFVIVHTIWGVGIALGFAQTLLDWMMSLHFVQVTHSYSSFNLTSLLTLLVVAAVRGYVGGYILASVWNYWNKK